MSSQVFAGDTSGSVTIQCPAVAGSNVLTLPLSNGLIPGELVYVLGTGSTGANATGAQSTFGLTNGITLTGNTTYQFEILFTMIKTAGTTSHTVTPSFGGTAAITNIFYQSYEVDTSGGVGTRATNQGISYINTSSATYAITGALTAATQLNIVILKGVASIGTGGTFLPQYTLSAAPGGAYTIQAGSYIKLSPLGTGSSGVNIGSWS